MLSSARGESNSALLIAFKLERVQSHIKFLRECRRRDFIPKGFYVSNKLKSTLPGAHNFAAKLIIKQSREWMNLAIDELYRKKKRIEYQFILFHQKT